MSSAEKLLLYQLAVSAVFAAAVLAVLPVRRSAKPALVPTLALLFQAIYVVAFTYVLWFWLMRRYPASGLVELRLPDAGHSASLCSGLSASGTAQRQDLHRARPDRRRADHRQPAAAPRQRE